MEGAHPAITFVGALAAGVLAQAVARHARVPGIVVLLGVGAAMGPDGLGWIRPAELGHALFTIVELSVAIILFEGGMNLELSRLRRASAPIRRLVLLGALVTLAGGAASAGLFLGWSFSQAVLFGSLVVVTGPTVIGPLLQDLHLRPRLATVLEAEGVLIDPVGALLAALVLAFVLDPGGAIQSEWLNLAERVGFGVAAGGLGGFALAYVLRIRRLVPEGQSNILALAAVLFLFQGCEELAKHSGILAVTIAGVTVGNLRSPDFRDLKEFKDQLTVMLIGLLFVLLAADVRIEDVRALGLPGVAVVATLVAIARPLGVWLSTVGSDLDGRERILLAWVAPRGIVAAAVASLTAAALDESGLAGGAELRALVFLTIATTVLLAGFTARPIAQWLGVRMPGRERIAILGAQGLGLLLARELAARGVKVSFLDSNPHNSRAAEEAGYPVVFGNALEERTMGRARFETVGAVVGLTANETLNGLFVARAHELFGVPTGYVALYNLRTNVTQEFVEHDGADALFEAAHDVERWDVRYRHGDTIVRSFVRRGGEAGEVALADVSKERFVVLTRTRGGQTTPMSVGLELRDGDVVGVALFRPELDAALEALAQAGLEPEPETEPASESPPESGEARAEPAPAGESAGVPEPATSA